MKNRAQVDKTPAIREFYGRKELFQFCKNCQEEYWGSYKTSYCCKECGYEYRRKRDFDGLIPSRRNKKRFQKNHKIRSIKYYPKTIDTFDIEVPELGNFVAEGVVVHNSSHGSDAFRCFAVGYKDRTGKRGEPVKRMFKMFNPRAR